MKIGKPSATSLIVALGSLCILRSADNTGWDSRIEPILNHFFKKSPFFFRILEVVCRFKLGRKILTSAMNIFIPGMFVHYVARKMYIEMQARNSLTNGVKQVVVIGAGFDTLSLRLASDIPSVFFLKLIILPLSP